jgi:hypothetical protein
VIARKEPMVERALRFLRRNRVAVAVAALVLLSSGVGIWKTMQAQYLARQIEAREAVVQRLLDGFERRNSSKPSASPAQRGPSSSPSSSPSLSSGSRVDDIQKLRHALEKDLAATWSAQPGITPQRQALLERVLKYLDSVRTYAEQNPLLANELAAAYKDVGVLYEPSLSNHALMAYRNAALILLNASGGLPEKGANSGLWVFLAARIKTLGGTVPLYTLKTEPAVTLIAQKPKVNGAEITQNSGQNHSKSWDRLSWSRLILCNISWPGKSCSCQPIRQNKRMKRWST